MDCSTSKLQVQHCPTCTCVCEQIIPPVQSQENVINKVGFIDVFVDRRNSISTAAALRKQNETETENIYENENIHGTNGRKNSNNGNGSRRNTLANILRRISAPFTDDEDIDEATLAARRLSRSKKMEKSIENYGYMAKFE